MLVRLMYASRATAGVDEAALSAIVRQSRDDNAAAGITGVLCFGAGTFVQLLEGDRAALSRLYGRIACDARHAELELLGFEEIGERCFTGWTMGHVSLNRLNPGLLLKYSAKPVFDPFSLSATAMLALFKELVATAAISGP